MWFANAELVVWMVIAQVAFLVVPGLMALAYEWFRERSKHDSGHDKHTDLSNVVPIRRPHRPMKAA